MADPNTIDKDYDQIAAQYESITDLPVSQMEQQLVEYALGDCTGKTVLDLGGGTGMHARKAIDLGAIAVDNVDISPGMLDDGKAIEKKMGRSDNIRWLVGDVTQSLDNLPLENSYDIVLMGWTFDHAESSEQLEGMWRNVAKYARNGTKLINTRMANPLAASAKSGNYGVKFSEFQDIPGGIKYVYTAFTSPEFSCPATSMHDSMDLEQSKETAKKHGFTGFETVPAKEMQVAQSQGEFWQLYLDDPFFVVITATKEA